MATIVSDDDIFAQFVGESRKASGLRLQECMDLVLEKIQRSKEGYFITHSRVKQRRSDKLESRFLVPEAGGFAAQLALYLFKVNNQLKNYQGRVWFTGTKSDSLRNQPMGRNMVVVTGNNTTMNF